MIHVASNKTCVCVHISSHIDNLNNPTHNTIIMKHENLMNASSYCSTEEEKKEDFGDNQST